MIHNLSQLAIARSKEPWDSRIALCRTVWEGKREMWGRREPEESDLISQGASAKNNGFSFSLSVSVSVCVSLPYLNTCVSQNVGLAAGFKTT